MRKVCFIQLCRLGDITSALPMMWARAQAGDEVSCIVHEQFADVLDGVTYVKKIVHDGLHRDVNRCIDIAKSLGFDECIATQLDGNELSRTQEAHNFHERQWRLGGMWDKWHKLPLIFDRRNKIDEERELKQYSFPFRSEKPILLYALHGHSSPFYKFQQFEKWLKGNFSGAFTLFDIGKVICNKPYSLLAFMERADVLVSAATFPVPLAYACGIPTICLCCDTDPNGQIPNREFFWPEPRKHWLGRMSYGESLTPEGQSRIKGWVDKQAGVSVVASRSEPAKPSLPLPAKTPFNEYPQPEHASITLGVPTGIGDIVWVYQKFAPYFSRINFRVLSTGDDPVSRRAISWLRLLPKVGNVDFQVDNPNRVRNLIAKPCTMREAFDKWAAYPNSVIDYACNAWLERGVRLDEIDPGSVIETDVKLAEEPFALPHESYAILYASGDSRHDNLHRLSTHAVWTVNQWVQYIKLTWERFNLRLPIVIIGANFDKDVALQLKHLLTEHLFDCSTMIGERPERVVHLLKNCEFFAGYQSGLNIIADLLDVKQQILYFPFLADTMRNTWCKRENIRTKFFADSFANSPEQVAASHQLFETSTAIHHAHENCFA
jgi:ADP-heptose:LPS heptosyltransferase